jgi:hypothetical protein
MTVGGRASVGNDFIDVLAPSNGLIVQGRMGVGKSNPECALDVDGEVRAGQGVFAGTVRVNNSNTTNNKLLVLWDSRPTDNVNSATEFFGLGINPSILRYQVNATSKHCFYIGDTEKFAVTQDDTFVTTRRLSIGDSTQRAELYMRDVSGARWMIDTIHGGLNFRFNDQNHVMRLERNGNVLFGTGSGTGEVRGGKGVFNNDLDCYGLARLIGGITTDKDLDCYGIARLHNGFAQFGTGGGGVGQQLWVNFLQHINNWRITVLSWGDELGAGSFNIGNIRHGPNHWATFQFRDNGELWMNGNPRLTSDDRLKTDETLITNALPILNKLRPQTYYKHMFLPSDSNFNTSNDYARFEAGLIAQEVFYDCPELRHIVELPRDANSNALFSMNVASSSNPQIDPVQYNQYWGTTPASVSYMELIPYLIKGVNELTAMVHTMSDEIARLKQAQL